MIKMSFPDEFHGIAVVMLKADILNDELNGILATFNAPPNSARAAAVDVQVGNMILPLLKRLLDLYHQCCQSTNKKSASHAKKYGSLIIPLGGFKKFHIVRLSVISTPTLPCGFVDFNTQPA